MKLLRRLLLINWHYINYQLIEFDRVNFLTGKNASGKSTLIDALQLLMLGDTVGSFFNKAANEKSRRSLKGYLWGEVAENEEEGLVFLRSGNFTSYIAGEFEDTVKGKFFSLGVVFDCFAPGEYNHRFFAFNDRLPENHFIHHRVPLSISQLRDKLYASYGRSSVEFFESNQRYRETLRGRMGNLNDKFFRLFRKAVPFSPIMDIKGFISEFVCDVKGKVDIEDMWENIRHYKQLENELEIVKKRLKDLENVNTRYLGYDKERQRSALQQFIISRAGLEQKIREMEALKHEAEKTSGKIKQLDEKIREIEVTINELEKQKDNLGKEKSNLDISRLEQYLKGEKDRLQLEVDQRKKNRDHIRRVLFNTVAVWRSMIIELENSGTDSIDLSRVQHCLDYLRQAAEGGPELLNPDILGAARESMEGLRSRLADIFARLTDELNRITKSLEQLQREIKGLKQGVKPYSKRLISLVEVIAAEIKKSTGREVVPEVFADTLEIRDEKWRNAIEEYLHTQKFYLLVKPGFYTSALKAFDLLKLQQEFYDLGLVDLEKVLERRPVVLPGSLAGEVETSDPYARAYADFLLGRVIKCEKVEDLRRYDTSITPSGMLYQRFVARRINPERYRQPYIGRRAVQEQMRLKEGEAARLREQLAKLKPRYELIKRIKDIQGLSHNDIASLLEWNKSLADLPELERELQAAIKKYGSLDLSYLKSLGGEIDKIKEQIKELNKTRDICIRDRGRAENRLEVINGESLPRLEEESRQKRSDIENAFPPEWREETGEPVFLKELERQGNLTLIIANYAARLEESRSLGKNKWDELVRLRGDYIRHYKSSLDINQEQNRDWEKEAARLKDTMLTRYEDKIKKAREKAQLQFQEDFISKLRQNIETVERQLYELNLALKDVPFGRDRYWFKVVPNKQYRRYYDMIMSDLLIEGYNVFSTEFQAKYGDVVNELFRRIVDTDEGEMTAEQRIELEKNLERFTDYRTYLDFDLMVTDGEGIDSRLSVIITKKSGGETQTPFYISVLASFLQLYRVRQKGFDNTLRLIVFDEAYSKMDHQRIRESIRLIREMELQVVISAPTEKVAEIAPLVDRNLCVTRVGKETFIRAFDPRRVFTKN